MTRVSVETPTNAGGRDLSHEDRVSAAPDEALGVRKLRDRKDGRRPPRTAPNPCAPHEAVARTCAGSWTARCNASGRQFLPTGRKRVEHPLRLPSKYQTNEPGRACQSIELQRSARAASPVRSCETPASHPIEVPMRSFIGRREHVLGLGGCATMANRVGARTSPLSEPTRSSSDGPTGVHHGGGREHPRQPLRCKGTATG